MTTSSVDSTSTPARVIRVFVSSTFRDMQAEREELVKRIFPQLRKLCEARGIVWGEVDLRWGITDEQKAEGHVLPICLTEIHNCRPYFIGLLGERYGWVPQDVSHELMEGTPWLAEYRQHSVTELEILHGVLNNPQMAGHAFFYFRSPDYVASLPLEIQPDFGESATPEEIEQFGADDAARRAADRKRKLAFLKQRIRSSGVPVREGFPNARTLGELVLADFTDLINRLFPPGSQPDPLDSDAAEHEAFAATRTLVYIRRQDYFDRLDEHARGEGPPLVVLGESGSGKSTLLANWSREYRPSHPDELILLHFIGATHASADWAAMLRRILGELNRRLGLSLEIPDEPAALRAAFANSLHMTAARGRAVLVLDALNQLEDRDQALDLVWLPPVIPANVRMILSTLPGRPLDDLKRRAWPSVTIDPLSLDERKRLIVDYLAQYTKALSPARLERIAAAPQTANPLYLRALLEELRVFGLYELLDQRIDHYLAATKPDALYQKILARFEQDYERDRPNLVREAMSLLWAARRGLSQAELLQLLGSNGQPLPAGIWSPLFLAAEQSLVTRSGLIGFFHDYLRQAVRDHYLRTEEEQRAAHLRLADHFAAAELAPRKVDELPWQLAQAHSWTLLYDLLSDLTFFQAAWEANQFQVKVYWAQVEANAGLNKVEAYRQLLEGPDDYDKYVWDVATLLGDTGRPIEALTLREYVVQQHRKTGDRANLQAALGNQAASLFDRGDLDGAMALYKEQERLCQELGHKRGLEACFGNQARILHARGQLDEAMALFKEQELLCRELGHKSGMKYCLGNQALILKDRGELDAALTLIKEQEYLSRQSGDKHVLQAALGNQATILYDRGALGAAMALFQEQEQLCRELGYKDGLSISLGNQALILTDRGELDAALVMTKAQEQLSREVGDKNLLQAALGIRAAIFRVRGDLDVAMALNKETEQLCRELGNKAGLQGSLGNQALILRDEGKLDAAMGLMKEQERLCRELGSKNGLQQNLGNQATILLARGELQGAMTLLKQKEQLCEELGNKQGLQVSLGNQAVILKARGEWDAAIALMKEQERLCRELGDKNGLQRSLNNQALILHERGDLEAAMTLHKEAERLCRELGNKADLQGSLGNQALVLKDQGELDAAFALLKEQERLCGELRDKAGLANTLGNQATILQARCDWDEAVALYKRSEQLSRELGSIDRLSRLLANQAVLLAGKLGRPQEALPLAEEGYRLAADHGLAAVARQTERILRVVRAMISETEIGITELPDKLVASRERAVNAINAAIAAGGDVSKIAAAQQSLGRGDSLSASGTNPVNEYEDAFTRAQGAVY
jgi:ATP/maltotriose-dependent transcriptional regulator MalT